MRRYTLIILVVILLLGIILRTYSLATDPPELFGDELDVGYQAYSLLQTGRDLTGHFLPFYLQSLTEFREPLYIYSAVPSVAIFGLNEIGVRFPAAFWGVLGIVGLFLLIRKLFGDKAGLFSALLLSISPWDLQYSRASFEVTMLLAFIIFATYFFIKSLEKGYYLIFSILLFGLAVYIYSTAVVFVPTFFLLLLIVHYKKIKSWIKTKENRKWLIISFLILILTALPIFKSVIDGQASTRFNSISIFQNSVLLEKINASRQLSTYYNPDGSVHTVNPILETIFHNKPLAFGQVFAQNYLEGLSFDFLFSFGDPNLRQSVQEMGMMYLFELPLILLGTYFLIKKSDKTKILFILGWLILAPIPASLTDGGGYHATRLILELLPLEILAALGATYLFDNKNIKFIKIFGMGVIILAFLNFTIYLHRYYVDYPKESWRFWQTGFKEAMTYMKSQQNNYRVLVFNNTYEPSLIRFLVYFQYPPAEFQSQYHSSDIQKNILPGFDGFSLTNKYYFGTAPIKGTVADVIKPGMLYMLSQRDEVVAGDWRKNTPKNIVILKTITDPFGNPIFYVVTAKS